ncbi:hypothetical protein CEXT_542991 [Caerostris extrusa]|uniref:Uncharacterized protein n=1 Tax=Caerostris extrusa TaxID=172846 RepID=A0AAV4Y0W1_CAEEX|nr:hypothetical protein CEXT_542991 [Caerostris extrusa]
MIAGRRLEDRGGNLRMNAEFSGMTGGLKLVRGVPVMSRKQSNLSPISGTHVGSVCKPMFIRWPWDYSERNIGWFGKCAWTRMRCSGTKFKLQKSLFSVKKLKVVVALLL